MAHDIDRRQALAGALLWPAIGSAFTSAAATPSDPRAARVDELFVYWNKPTTAGCGLAVLRDGQIVYRRAYGMARLKPPLAMKTSTVCYAGSVSKQFTAAAVAMLAEDGRLSLDADVHQYLPDLPDYGAAITVRHLVHHTSGIKDHEALMRLIRPDLVPTEGNLLPFIARQNSLNYAPGTEHSYSNTNYTLLALIVRRVSGQRLQEFAADRIFAPLGMRSSYFYDYTRPHCGGPLAIGYDGECGLHGREVGPGNLQSNRRRGPANHRRRSRPVGSQLL